MDLINTINNEDYEILNIYFPIDKFMVFGYKNLLFGKDFCKNPMDINRII